MPEGREEQPKPLERQEEEPAKEAQGNISALEGLANLGFLVKEKKGQALGNLYEWAAEKTAGNVEEKAERAILPRLFAAYADLYKREAEEAIKARDSSKETRGQLAGIAALAGNSLYYGRVLFDVGVANPFRHLMAASMFLGKGAEAVKEARMMGSEAIDETRLRDEEQAFEEAGRVYERARERVAGRVLSREDLDNAYQNFLPEDLKKRLENHPSPTLSLAQKIARWGVERKANKLADKMSYIESSPDFSPAAKEAERRKILQKNKSFLRDMDRMVGQAGAIDLISYGARTFEKGAKAASTVLAVESLGRFIAHAYHVFEPAEAYAAGKAPQVSGSQTLSPTSSEDLRALLKKEEWRTLEVKPGDSPLKVMQSFYEEHIDKVAPKFGADPNNFANQKEMRHWVETVAARHVVGQFIIEYGSAANEQPDDEARTLYEKMMQAAGKGEEAVDWNNPENMNKALAALSKDEFSHFLNAKVPNLIHAGDRLTVSENGNIVFLDPAEPRGHIAIGEGRNGGKAAGISTDVRGGSSETVAAAAGKVVEVNQAGGEKRDGLMGDEPALSQEVGATPQERNPFSFEQVLDAALPKVNGFFAEDPEKLSGLEERFSEEGDRLSEKELSQVVDAFSSGSIAAFREMQDSHTLGRFSLISEYIERDLRDDHPESAETFKKLSEFLANQAAEVDINETLKITKYIFELSEGGEKVNAELEGLTKYFSESDTKLSAEEVRGIAREFSQGTVEKFRALKDIAKLKHFVKIADYLFQTRKVEPFRNLGEFLRARLELAAK